MLCKPKVLLICIYVIVLHISFAVPEEQDFSIDNELVLKKLQQEQKTKSPEGIKVGSISGRGQIEGLLNEVEGLKRIISKIEHREELDEKINQCISSIQRGNEAKAHKHWREILAEADSTEPKQLTKLLRKIVIDTYAGNRENILPVLGFINFTQVFTGLYGLMDEMRDYGHLYGGTEIFYIASLIRENCGRGSKLYSEVPIGVQYIDSSSVHLLSEKNQGLLVYKPRSACQGRFCTRNEVFTYHLPLESLGSDSQPLRALWTFRVTNESTRSTPTTFALKPYTPMDPRFVIENKFNGTRFLHMGLEINLSPNNKDRSIFTVHLVNGSEDVVRIRYEQNHLVRKLLKAENYLGNTFTPVQLMGTGDWTSEANDGNWIVIPVGESEVSSQEQENNDHDNDRRKRRYYDDEVGGHDQHIDFFGMSPTPEHVNFPVICDF